MRLQRTDCTIGEVISIILATKHKIANIQHGKKLCGSLISELKKRFSKELTNIDYQVNRIILN